MKGIDARIVDAVDAVAVDVIETEAAIAVVPDTVEIVVMTQVTGERKCALEEAWALLIVYFEFAVVIVVVAMHQLVI